MSVAKVRRQKAGQEFHVLREMRERERSFVEAKSLPTRLICKEDLSRRSKGTN